VSFLKKIIKAVASTSTPPKAAGPSSDFSYLVEGKEPLRDSQNRIIVSFLAGQQIEHEVKTFSYDETIRELLGKPSEDFESRKVRLRLILNPGESGAKSIDIETVKGNKVGRFLEDEISRPLQIFSKVGEFLGSVDGRLASPLVFEVSADIEGSWEYVEDVEDDEDHDKPYWEPSLDSVVVKIKDPLTFDIKSAN
jgi:hypothetical protein